MGDQTYSDIQPLLYGGTSLPNIDLPLQLLKSHVLGLLDGVLASLLLLLMPLHYAQQLNLPLTQHLQVLTLPAHDILLHINQVLLGRTRLINLILDTLLPRLLPLRRDRPTQHLIVFLDIQSRTFSWLLCSDFCSMSYLSDLDR